MRLAEIYDKFKDNYQDIYRQYEKVYQMYEIYKKSEEPQRVRARREEALKDELHNFSGQVYKRLGEIECFETSLKRMDVAIGDNELAMEEKVERCYGPILQMQSIIVLYQSMGHAQSIGLDIKIPETDNITEFKKYIDNLEFIFTKCPFFQSDEASLKLETADSGSIWLVIGVACASVAAGSALLNNIAAFVDKCFVIKSHRLTCKRQEQEIEKAKLEQNEKEELIKNVNKMYKIGVANAIRELEESTEYHIKDGDEMGRVEQAFEKLEKMIDKGMQIYSSIDSPDEVKVLFKPLEMHYLSIAEELKQIAEKSDAEVEG